VVAAIRARVERGLRADNAAMTRAPLPRRTIAVLAVLAIPALAVAQASTTFTLPRQVVSTTPTPALETARGRLQCSGMAYPPAAIRAQATGKSTVHVRVAPDGRVVDVHLLRPAGVTREHDLLDSATVEAVRHGCTFTIAPGVAAPADDRWIVMSFQWRLDQLYQPQEADASALQDLRERASRGDANAAFSFYLRAPYDEPGIPEAIRWLTFAADHDVARAQFELGRLDAIGEGLPQDLSQTVAWWGRAAAHHDSRTTLVLVDMLLDKQGPQHDAPRAIALLEQAAADGSGAAMLRLGDLAAAGTEMPRDERAALADWRRAALDGRVSLALVRLGDAWLAGQGVKADPLMAATYYAMARLRNEPTAAGHLAAMHADADTLAKADAAANRWHLDGERTLPE
jgi:TonB family protein